MSSISLPRPSWGAQWGRGGRKRYAKDRAALSNTHGRAPWQGTRRPRRGGTKMHWPSDQQPTRAGVTIRLRGASLRLQRSSNHRPPSCIPPRQAATATASASGAAPPLYLASGICVGMCGKEADESNVGVRV